VIHLERIDRSRNMARFYRLGIKPDLFGAWALEIEFGRIGQGGTIRRVFFVDEISAIAAMQRQHNGKLRKGYRSLSEIVVPNTHP